MSVVPICCKIPYKDQTTQLQKPARHDSKDMIGTRTTVVLSTNSNEKHLKSLTCYLEKLQLDNKKPTKHSSDSFMEKLDDRKGSQVLENHLEKPDHKKDINYSKEEAKRPLFGGEYLELQDEMKSRRVYARHGILRSSRRLEQEEYDTSNLYLIGVLASINIAVILFQIASPVKSSELELSAIPIAYGAKVNHLIVIGQWWRLVTPMFLHSGAFDIGLSCWSLWTFGPKVCRGYGWFTFLLIYFLGGISSNLISFLHTPQLTVGGTGPSYAIIGAWLTYQLQNKDAIPKDVSETMFEKAVIATGLGLILTHFCPIDEWAHFGAVFTGVAYGFLSRPTFQEDESASTSQPYDPLKSLFVFGFFVLILTLLFILVEPPLND